MVELLVDVDDNHAEGGVGEGEEEHEDREDDEGAADLMQALRIHGVGGKKVKFEDG